MELNILVLWMKELKKQNILHHGVAGIHFDYLKYPGNAYKYNGGINVINSFIKQAVTELKKRIKI